MVPFGFDSHFGDIEHTRIEFENGLPTVVHAFWHGHDDMRAFNDIERLDKHPITYNAAGTHATYYTSGLQLPKFDWTFTGVNWDFWKCLDIVFPWDYTSDRFQISTNSNLNGMNYMTQVFRWGNESMGLKFGNDQILLKGPEGYLSKFNKSDFTR